MMECYSCYEPIEREELAWCRLCKESGQICHECLMKWGNEGNDITVCTICKRGEVMEHLPPMAVAIVVDDPGQTGDTFCKVISRLYAYFMIWTILSYMGAILFSLLREWSPSVEFETFTYSSLGVGLLMFCKRDTIYAWWIPPQLRE